MTVWELRELVEKRLTMGDILVLIAVAVVAIIIIDTIERRRR